MLKLLIVKTSSLGDVIHNLPIINDILKHCPDVEIGLGGRIKLCRYSQAAPRVKHVIPVAIRRWRKALFTRQTWLDIKAAKQQLRNNITISF